MATTAKQLLYPLDAIRDIAQSFRNRELVVFCGAGISRNSGIPLAKDQKDHILAQLPFERSQLYGVDKLACLREIPDLTEATLDYFFENPDRQRLVFRDDFAAAVETFNCDNETRALWWKLYMGTVYGKIIYTLPFEAFWETLGNVRPVERAFHIYAQGKPTAAHSFFARLAKQKYLRSIVTTNFDLLLEQAFHEVGLEFNVFADESQYRCISSDSERFNLIKIHGSAHDYDSIRTTISLIAKREFSDARGDVIRDVFSSGPHKTVLVIGYSWSDEFDLSPQIAALKSTGKFIYWIDHKIDKASVTPLDSVSSLSPVYGYPGMRIECNANQLIADLNAELFAESINLCAGQTTWKKDIDAWLEEVNQATAEGIGENSLAGCLLNSVSEPRFAITYFSRVLASAFENKAIEPCYFACDHLALSYLTLGDLDKAKIHFEGAVSASRAAGHPAEIAHALIGLGRCDHRSGDYNRAFEHYSHAQEILTDMPLCQDQEACLRYMGETLLRKGLFEQAVNYLMRALVHCSSLGAIAEEAACLSSLANAWNESGDHDKALEALQTSITIWRKMGNKHGEAVVCINLGMTYRKKSDYPSALEHQQKALRIFEEIGDQVEVARCQTNIGNLHRILRNFQNALGHHTIAGDIAERLGNRPLQAMVSMNRGALFADMNNNVAAIIQYKQAAAMFGISGNRSEMANCLRWISERHIKMGHLSEALESLEIAKNEYAQLGAGRNMADCEKMITSISRFREKTTTSSNQTRS